ncbi:MAG: TlpA family protein disulfide reductase [Chloroflexi bacterium]|nr:MAG: TlpA family protein disulfide reductase [Chloroflexota bacterium]
MLSNLRAARPGTATRPAREGILKTGRAMDERGPAGIKLTWWLAGGCAIIVACLIAAGMGATLGWAVFGSRLSGAGASADSAPATSTRLRGNPVGQPAPAFTLRDVEGTEVTLKDFRGRPVLINFWATWCAPCRSEMPIIEEAYQQHQDEGLIVLAIDVQENPELARTFAGWLGISFTILDDGAGDVARLYRVTAFPTSFFVDRNGVIRAWQVGAMNRSTLDRHLGKIMK